MKPIDYIFEIESIEDVEAILPYLKQKHGQDATIYYRGQSNRDWNLIPSIARFGDKEPVFENLTNHTQLFSKLSRMQHYYMPTRLLDYTTDLYVALYFACLDAHKNHDGCLYATNYHSMKDNYQIVPIICALTQLKEPITIENFVKDILKVEEKSKQDQLIEYIASMIHFGFIVEPTQNFYKQHENVNPRILAQKGCFYIPGNKTDKSLEGINKKLENARNIKILPSIESTSHILTSYNFTTKFIIPCKLKNTILKYLNSKGINKKTLYLE